MKKLLLITALILATALMAVACHNEGSGETTVEEATSECEEATTEPEVTTAEPEGTTAEPEETTAESEKPTAEPEETTAEPEESTTEPDNSEIEFTIFEDLFHANIDFINGGSNGGAGVPYRGLGASTVNGIGIIPVRNAADDGIMVNDDCTINLKGWMAVYGGINRYVYRVNEGEYINAVGGADGEPLPGHYAGYGMPNSLKNGMFNVELIVADLSAYVGQTITITFYAVPQNAQNTLAPMITIEGLVVTDNEAETTEPETDEPEAPVYPAWNDDKAIVTHQSFDQLYTGTEGGAGPHNMFEPGKSATWNKTALLDASVECITYWGWIGIKGSVGQFGYQIDGNEVVFDDSFTFATEQGVIDAAKPTGCDTASRMKIIINTKDLSAGEHTVHALYKNPDGDIVELNTFTLILQKSETDPVEPEIPVYPAWNIDKAVVTHQSFERLYTSAAEGSVSYNIFNSAAGWNKTAYIDASVESLNYFGWIGIRGSVGLFGYQIDGNEAVFDEAFTFATEPAVINAAAPTGSDTASRMMIVIKTDGLAAGEYTINVLYKNSDGDIVAINTFKLVVVVPPTEASVYKAWNADKAIVTHQSFDQLYIGTEGGAGSQNFFDPGKAVGWNGIAGIPSDVADITYWGWIGIKGAVGQFGYQIDDGETIFDDMFTFTTEQAVINAAAPTGSDTASRMKVIIHVEGLESGAHNINVLYKNPNDEIVALRTFILVK